MRIGLKAVAITEPLHAGSIPVSDDNQRQEIVGVQTGIHACGGEKVLDPRGRIDAPTTVVVRKGSLETLEDQCRCPLHEDQVTAAGVGYARVIRLPSTCRKAFDLQVSRMICIRCEAS